MSITRRRLSSAESREAALDAARDLLIENGPQSVTLKAVSARIGRTHANLLHHFGSAAGLQEALAQRMTATITAQIGAAALRARSQGDPSEVVDLTFDAFGRQGGGALASWMILSGNHHLLDPVLDAIHRLVDELASDSGLADVPLADETLHLVLIALGDALLGGAMAQALGLPPDRARALARKQLLSAYLEHARDGG
ncbi:TetR/AcrR family transcriptional regulator [Sphingomonas sp. 3-13AW]|jgi:AcrR family transcriptional regulator|uniref:TetR/AcrR family transcriptional regulator n=1 Tax=Sphingomonas sp. 3-13AW TaxID=3050450 RepID=UPI003BB493EE